MPTVIRFSRHGTKKKPFFRMVVQDKTKPRDGRFIENIGTFDPIKSDTSLTVKRDRLEYWLGTGAIMSDSVKNRLKLKRREWLAGGTTVEAKTAAPAVKVPKEAKAPKADKPKKSAKTKEA
jgi:small subunit ribosomal protein S16